MHAAKSMIAIVFSLAMSAGCCREVRNYPPPKPGDLVAQVRARNRRAQTLKAVVKADQLTRKGRVKLKVFLLVEQGGKLRFEATVMDNTVAVLVSDGQQFASVDFKKHVVYRGPASPCNIARVFNVPLTGQQVAVVLTGGVPVIRHDAAKLRWDKCEGQEILTLRSKKFGLTQHVYLKKKKGGWQIVASKIKNRKGRTLMKISARGFRRRSGLWMPRWIHFVHKKKKADVLMRFISQKLNVEIPAQAFQLDPPANLPQRWLRCEDRGQLPFLPVSTQAGQASSAAQ
jgi:outer membrane lipoprotein-sorting protein